ncbi:hypothetical protein [Roseibium sp.]|uniref:hypothetical protein n=1 Tax=Roseibium sp. TaxID=1936156 RepID=UPI003BAC053A
MPNTNKFPLSFFESVRNPIPEETCELVFDEFTEIMSSFSEEPFASKEAAPLFSSTVFNQNRRSKKNATSSGLIVLDIDDGQTIDQTLDVVGHLNLAFLIYSTASHRDEHHKFRICVPLIAPVAYDEQVLCWRAVNYVFASDQSDATKAGCESLFYVPGTYPGAPTVFIQQDGDVYSAADWIDVADLPEQPASVERSIRCTVPAQSATPGASAATADDLDIYETRLITETALNKYQSAYGDWHTARFGLMLHMVGRARRIGIDITESDVVDLFNQVDAIDGSHYQTERYQKEITNDARKAVAQAG